MLTYTPHWAFPTMIVFVLSVCASMFGTGCAADVGSGVGTTVGSDTNAPVADDAELCGGAVCFSPTDVAVKHWGDGDVTIVAWRADERRCEVPHAGPEHAGGRAIELRLHEAKPGARLPIVSHAMVELAGNEPCATVRALRIGPQDGRPLADEETVSGEATVLDLDPHSGRVRVRVSAHWSSGVTRELLLDVDGPHACAAE